MSEAMRASAHTRAESRETDKVSGSTAAASSADLLPAVAQAYGLTTRLQARKLTGGYANDVFLLEAEGPVVLHIKHPPLDLNSLTSEHQLLDLLRDRLPEAPAPLTALDGRTFLLHDQQLVWLTPYLPGHPAAPVDVRAVASVLGRLHSVRIGVSPRPGHLRLSDVPIPPIRQMPSEFDDWLSLITQARSETMELINASSASLKYSAHLQIGILAGITSWQTCGLISASADVDFRLVGRATTVSSRYA